MDEEQELQSRIHALQGKKVFGTASEHNTEKDASGRITTATSYRPAPRSRNAQYRAAPYYVPRGRGRGRGHGYPTSTRGRTQELNEQVSAPQIPINHPSGVSPTVSKSDQLRQLSHTPVNINKQLDEATLPEIDKQRQREHDENERRQLSNHPDATSTKSYSSAPTSKPYELKINNIPFQVTDGGKKLVCMSSKSSTSFTPDTSITSHLGDSKTRQAVPQKHEVAGVVFYKSKNGNLYRAGAANSHMYGGRAKREQLLTLYRSRDGKIKKSASLCPNFTATGNYTLNAGSRP
jgi:hypothetical protein